MCPANFCIHANDNTEKTTDLWHESIPPSKRAILPIHPCSPTSAMIIVSASTLLCVAINFSKLALL